MTNYIVLFVCIFAVLTINASPIPDHPLTISEMIDMALGNHPSTKQAWWNARRAAFALGRAKSSYYPSAAVEAHGSHGRDFKFINGPDTNYTIVGTDLTLAFLLFDGGERNAVVESAKMGLIAANWQSEWAIQKVMVRVFENAHQLIHAREIFQAASIAHKEAEAVWEAAKELNRAGLAPVIDVYTSGANLSLMKIEWSKQKGLLDIRMGELAVNLGLSVDAYLEIVPIDQFPAFEQSDICSLIDLASKQRADLLAKQAQVAESAARQKQAGIAFGPKLMFVGRGGTDHAVHDKAHGAHYEVRLDLEVPLFTGFDALYQKRAAFTDVKISKEELAELELDIALEVLTASRTLEMIQEILPDAEEYLANSIKAYEGALEKYKAGKERIFELSQAQQQLAQARVRYSEIKTGWWSALARLAYATGSLPMGCQNE